MVESAGLGAVGARPERHWAGLVDMTPDGPPVVGEIVADLALTGTTHWPVGPFSLTRFDGVAASLQVMI